MKSRDADGPILMEITYREQPGESLITCHLEIDEIKNRLVVIKELLRWSRVRQGSAFKFLDYAEGRGKVTSGELPVDQDTRIEVPLSSADTLAVNTLGQLAENPRIVALRNFIMGWHVSYLSAEDARGQPEAGPQELLPNSGVLIHNWC